MTGVLRERQSVPPVDFAAVLDRCDGDEEFLKEISDAFRSNWGDAFGAIEKGFSQSNGEAASRSAHSLKGALLFIGAHVAAKMAETLELKSRAGALPDGAGLLAHFERELRRVDTALAGRKAR